MILVFDGAANCYDRSGKFMTQYGKILPAGSSVRVVLMIVKVTKMKRGNKSAFPSMEVFSRKVLGLLSCRQAISFAESSPAEGES